MVKYYFTGKVVLVTGSSRGMGATILEAFARAGATCLLHYFADTGGQNRKDAEQVAANLTAAGWKVQLYDAHVPKAGPIQALMQRVKADHRGIRVLVKNDA